MKLLLIDTDVEGYERIAASIQLDVRVVYFDRHVDTFSSLSEKCAAAAEGAGPITLGIVQHGDVYAPYYKLLETQAIPARVADVESSDHQLETWYELVQFYKTLGVAAIDLISCGLWANPGWVYVLTTLEKKLGIDFRASANMTGNIASGGDWVQESDGVNIQDVYFTEGIREYVGLLYSGQLPPDVDAALQSELIGNYVILSTSDSISVAINTRGGINRWSGSYKQQASREYIRGMIQRLGTNTLTIPAANISDFRNSVVSGGNYISQPYDILVYYPTINITSTAGTLEISGFPTNSLNYVCIELPIGLPVTLTESSTIVATLFFDGVSVYYGADASAARINVGTRVTLGSKVLSGVAIGSLTGLGGPLILPPIFPNVAQVFWSDTAGNLNVPGNLVAQTLNGPIVTDTISFPTTNIALGIEAGATNQGAAAVAVGYQAGSTDQGAEAIAIGPGAGPISQQTQAITLGQGAGNNNQGVGGIAIGWKSGETNQNDYSIAIGDSAGNSAQQSMSIAIGLSAGNTNQDMNSIAIGHEAGSIRQYKGCVAIGTFAGTNDQLDRTIAIGNQAGYTGQQSDSIALGTSAGFETQGSSAVAIGTTAGQNIQGVQSVAIGLAAGQNNHGAYSVAIGAQAGLSATGAYNFAVGSNAGLNLTNTQAVAIGTNASGSNAPTGPGTIAIGPNAGYSAQGSYSVAVGLGAAQLDAGVETVAIGTAAGYQDQGAGSVAIGAGAGMESQGLGAIAIGAGAGGISGTSWTIGAGFPTTPGTQIGDLFLDTITNFYYEWDEIEWIFVGPIQGSSQGDYAIAIGKAAGGTNQPSGSIVLNASGSTLDPPNAGLFVSPVRNDSTQTQPVCFDLTTNEVYFTDPIVIPEKSYNIAAVTYQANDTTVKTASLPFSQRTRIRDVDFVAAASEFTTTDLDLTFGKTEAPLLVATGFGPNTLAYSTDGISWTGLGTSIFSSIVQAVAYNGILWVAGGDGSANQLAYSYDGITWIGLGLSPTLQRVESVLWNGKIWMALTNSAYILTSNNGINWTILSFRPSGGVLDLSWNGLYWIVCATNGFNISYDGINFTFYSFTLFLPYQVTWNGALWVAVGDGSSTSNTIAYSYDGLNWSGLGKTIFSTSGSSVEWNGTIWVAVGSGTNTIAYSYNGINWVGLGTSIFSTSGNTVTWTGTRWYAIGSGTNTIAYSYNGVNWIGLGNILFTTGIDIKANTRRPHVINISRNALVACGSGTNPLIWSADQGLSWNVSPNGGLMTTWNHVAWNGKLWVAVGSGVNTLAYSYNGINWIGLGQTIFTEKGIDLDYDGTEWIAIGSGTNEAARSADGISWVGLGTIF
jgi:hypothetical protein